MKMESFTNLHSPPPPPPPPKLQWAKIYFVRNVIAKLSFAYCFSQAESCDVT